MDASKLMRLEDEAWVLRRKLDRFIEAEVRGQAPEYSIPDRKRKLYHCHIKAYERFLRRQAKT